MSYQSIYDYNEQYNVDQNNIKEYQHTMTGINKTINGKHKLEFNLTSFYSKKW